MPDIDDADSQDLAEVFDEENLTEDGYDIATPDEAADVYDVTAAEDDDLDDDLAGDDADDFDPDEVDEAEREAMLEEDDGVDEPHVRRDDTDIIPADSYAEDNDEDDGAEPWEEDRSDRESAARDSVEERLDKALDGTFPASDPVAIRRVD